MSRGLKRERAPTPEGRKIPGRAGSVAPLGLGVHGGTEPSAHALGYRLSALRAWGHGVGIGLVGLFRVLGVLRGEVSSLEPLPWCGACGCFNPSGVVVRFPWEPGVRFATPGYLLKSLRDRENKPKELHGAHLDTAPAWNGVATSSSPFQSHSQGDEDIAARAPEKAHRQRGESPLPCGE